MSDKFILRYLPKYEEDLNEIVDYISFKLHNSESALRLVDKIEKAIIDRLDCPLSFEPFQSLKKRRNSYYRIYVDNFIIYYVVIENIMEVRR
ncbi:MAG: type II toxin-antitoxin system RelE/ParE family toxin, partial [Firmicutes bacterium]|nr:type II toxin-antitoxin system RelE/ParE family toxin [Bacillota bacterium]